MLITELHERLRALGRDPHDVMRNAPAHAIDAIEKDEPVRAGLVRAVSFTPDADPQHGDGRTIEGYGAVFNSATRIASWEGEFDETITQGAFRKTLRDRTPIMQFDHGMHPLLGSLPLGRWNELSEDERGLRLRGRMYDNWLTEPFAMAIRDGGIPGMSFKFSVVRDRWADRSGKEITDPNELAELLYFGAGERGPLSRTLLEVSCSEVGPVVWPAYRDTTVGARSEGTMLIDLAGARANPRDIAFALTALEGAIADDSHIPESIRQKAYDPVARFAPIGQEELRHRAKAFVAEQHAAAEERRANTEPVMHTDAVDTPPAPANATQNEPRPTDSPAATHPDTTSAPHGTDDESAGQHSSNGQTERNARPANPVDRKSTIRQEYREFLNRTLVLPRQSD